MRDDKKKSEPGQAEKGCDVQRREFLRKSLYTAYATPVIMSVLVEKASAAVSADSNPGQCQNTGGTWIGTGASGCCDRGPGDGCGPNG